MAGDPLWKQLGLPKPRKPFTPLKPGKQPRKRPVQWEEQFQLTVAQYLDWALPKDAVWFAVPNGGWRTKGIAARLKACGVKAGVADIIILWRGTHHELELKWDSGQSAAQQEHACRVVAARGKYGIARRTLEDVYRQLAEWGIPAHKVFRGPTLPPSP